MFDIGFWELGLIFVVALLVVGPERLPRLARTAGMWVGKARSIVRTVKEDIDRELAAEELKKNLSKQAESSGLYDILEETRSIGDEARKNLDEASQAVKDTASAVTDDASDDTAATRDKDGKP
jgi:sec-independent protein translocase protein TatB